MKMKYCEQNRIHNLLCLSGLEYIMNLREVLIALGGKVEKGTPSRLT